MIYLASPYSDPDPSIMEYRYKAALHATGRMMQSGLHVFSPIVHCHPIIKVFNLSGDWAYWGKYDTELLKMCTELRVLKLPGWKKSKGVQAEIKIAKKLGLKISFINY